MNVQDITEKERFQAVTLIGAAPAALDALGEDTRAAFMKIIDKRVLALLAMEEFATLIQEGIDLFGRVETNVMSVIMALRVLEETMPNSSPSMKMVETLAVVAAISAVQQNR